MANTGKTAVTIDPAFHGLKQHELETSTGPEALFRVRNKLQSDLPGEPMFGFVSATGLPKGFDEARLALVQAYFLAASPLEFSAEVIVCAACPRIAR